MFGANLRLLAGRHASVAELSRQLEINRTQFNRYLSGESFPRPDVLDRICSFFNVDARILLEPLDSLGIGSSVLQGPVLGDFLGRGLTELNEEVFPSGFYRFSRRSFIDSSKFILGLVYVFRRSGHVYLKGFEPRSAMKFQGLPPSPRAREFRGFVTGHEEGVSISMSRYNGLTFSFNYLSRVASMENNYWSGYVVRTLRESRAGDRAARLVYEHLGSRRSEVLATARQAGFVGETGLLPYHRHLLRPDEPFY